jgi:hypothetical protein
MNGRDRRAEQRKKMRLGRNGYSDSPIVKSKDLTLTVSLTVSPLQKKT